MKAGNSYIGLARQASHSQHEQALIARAMLWRGHVVAQTMSGGFTKALRRTAID